jgi:hypothetical protein
MTDTPIYLAPVDKEFVPHKYILYIHSQSCNSCGSTHKHSEVYGETHIKAQSGGKYITNRRPVSAMTQVKYNLPITVIPHQTTVPFCHICFRPAMLSHLPNVPKPEPVLTTINYISNHPIVTKAPRHTPWLDKRGQVHTSPAEEPPTPHTKTKATRKFTVDDL